MSIHVFIPGRGHMPLDYVKLDRVVRDYDERLFFERHPETGQHCVFMKMPHGEAPLPLFGWDTIPHPDDALKRLHEADSLRHGQEILDRMNKKNEEIKAEKRYAADQAGWDAAERIEHSNKRLGFHPNPKTQIVVPKIIPKNPLKEG